MKKKNANTLIIIVVIALLIAGFGYFGYYIKKKMFNTDYIGCYEKIGKLEKAYHHQNTNPKGDMTLLKTLVEKYAPKAKIEDETASSLKVRYYCDYKGVVTFIFNGQDVMGRCAKHEDKYLKHQDHGVRAYHHAIYLTTTFDEDTKLDTSSLQQAFFYYEDGRKYGSYPQVKIGASRYALVPYYDIKTRQVTIMGVKNLNPFTANGLHLRKILAADAIYLPGKKAFALGHYQMNKKITVSDDLHKAKDYVFPDDDD